MPRPLTAAFAAALSQRKLSAILLFEGQFLTGWVNWSNAMTTKPWDSINWLGWAGFLTITEAEETSEIKSGGIQVRLAAVRPDQIALAQSEVRRNFAGRVWLALLNSSGGIIDDPRIIFRGRLSQVLIEDSTDLATLQLSYEHENITLERAKEIRYTDAEQKRLFPGDRGLEPIQMLADAVIRWGQSGG